MGLCKYRNLLGKPGKGAHSIRLFNIAIVDVLLTVLAAFLLAKLLNVSFILTLILLFVLAILVHWIFCVKTTVNKFLGLTRC